MAVPHLQARTAGFGCLLAQVSMTESMIILVLDCIEAVNERLTVYKI